MKTVFSSGSESRGINNDGQRGELGSERSLTDPGYIVSGGGHPSSPSPSSGGAGHGNGQHEQSHQRKRFQVVAIGSLQGISKEQMHQTGYRMQVRSSSRQRRSSKRKSHRLLRQHQGTNSFFFIVFIIKRKKGKKRKEVIHNADK